MLKIKSCLILPIGFIFLVNCLSCPCALAADISLPVPGTMVNLSPAFEPILIKGLKIHPQNPLLFDFIIDTGNDKQALTGDINAKNYLKKQSSLLINYFLASLTIPERDLWVNLSPYEKNRMIDANLGKTVMGRDMLSEDYILKQLTASLIYPEKNLGKIFWDKVYAKAQQMYGTSNVPINTFNKVWVVADRADVFVQGNAAYVAGAHLKVMLAEDYLSMYKHVQQGVTKTSDSIGSQIVREIILPEIEQEINTGKNFVPLRQMFYSMILATWYKMALKNTLLSHIYANRSKVKVGINQADPHINEKIYERYLKAYKKGVFDFIKEDSNGDGSQAVPRKYFSGGLQLAVNRAMRVVDMPPQEATGRVFDALVNLTPESLNMAMINGDKWVEEQLISNLKNKKVYTDFNALLYLYNKDFFLKNEIGFEPVPKRKDKISLVFLLNNGSPQWVNLSQQRFIMTLREIIETNMPAVQNFIASNLDAQEAERFELQAVIIRGLASADHLKQARSLEAAAEFGCPLLTNTVERLLKLWQPGVALNDARAALIATGVISRNPKMFPEFQSKARQIKEQGLQSTNFQIFETALTETLSDTPASFPKINPSIFNFETFKPSFKLAALINKDPNLLKFFPPNFQTILKYKFFLDMLQINDIKNPEILYEVRQALNHKRDKRLEQYVDYQLKRDEPLAAAIRITHPSSFINFPLKQIIKQHIKNLFPLSDHFRTTVAVNSAMNNPLPKQNPLSSPGGIDLDARKMQFNSNTYSLVSWGSMANDKAMLEKISLNGYDGMVFKIETILQIRNLLGISANPA